MTRILGSVGLAYVMRRRPVAGAVLGLVSNYLVHVNLRHSRLVSVRAR